MKRFAELDDVRSLQNENAVLARIGQRGMREEGNELKLVYKA